MGLNHGTNIVKDGLVFYVDAANSRSYPGSGTTVTDLKGTSNGTMSGDTSFNSSNFGVFNFDGTDDYISTSLIQSGTITVSCWFYTNDASTQMAFFGAGTTNPYQIRNFGLESGEYAVFVYTKDLSPNSRGIRHNSTEGSISYNTGQWTHFVGIIEKVTSTNANYYLYENGVLKLQVNDGYREQTTYPFFLGAMNNFGTATQDFNGQIGPIQMYNRALSAQEVKQNYNALKSRFGL